MRTFETHKELSAALAIPPANPGAFRFLPAYGPAAFRCVDCKKAVPLQIGGVGTGYACTSHEDDSDMVCYPCVGVREARELQEKGKGYLYLSKDAAGRYQLTNWPGTMVIPLHGTPRKGRHNMAGSRYDVWFAWNGAQWHGVQYGENSQVCRVRRLKAQ